LIGSKAVRTSGTSLLDEVVMVNPISEPATHADNEDIKASEIYDASQNLAKNNDGKFANTGFFSYCTV
jgi:hypothetical protein